MAKSNKGFCLFYDWMETLDYLDPADAYAVIRAISRYNETGANPVNLVETHLKATVNLMFQQIKRAEKVSEARAEAAKAMHEKYDVDDDDGLHSFAEQKSASAKQKSATNTDTDTNTITDTDTILSPSNEGDARTSKKRFVPPTVDEVFAYMQERGETDYTVAESFVDYYVNAKWRVGSSRTVMTDWKAAVRNWLRRENKGKPKVKIEKPLKESSFDTDAFMLTSLKRVYGEAGA